MEENRPCLVVRQNPSRESLWCIHGRGGEVGGLKPCAGDEAVAGGGRVHAIVCPEGWGLMGGGGGEEAIEGDEGGVKIAGELPDNFDFGIEVLAPLATVLGGWEEKRLHEEDLAAGQLVACLPEQLAVIGGEGFGGGGEIAVIAPPDIVNADKEGQIVGLEVDTVGLPALEEVGSAVAGDAAVEASEAEVGPEGVQEGGGGKSVALAEVVGVGFIALGVSNAVALKEEGLVGLYVHGQDRMEAVAEKTTAKDGWDSKGRRKRGRGICVGGKAWQFGAVKAAFPVEACFSGEGFTGCDVLKKRRRGQ